MIEQIIKGCDFDILEAAKSAKPVKSRLAKENELDPVDGIPHRDLGLACSALELAKDFKF